eukprot:gene2325-17960_t
MLVMLYEGVAKGLFDITLTRDGFVPSTASSLVVKEQRGEEPYMTIKMKCFYCDDEDYGGTWQRITSDLKCQTGLFDTCFKNRTIANRHETHVLALHNYCTVDRCSCNDNNGWCSSINCGDINIKCCLDIGGDSMIC